MNKLLQASKISHLQNGDTVYLAGLLRGLNELIDVNQLAHCLELASGQ